MEWLRGLLGSVPFGSIKNASTPAPAARGRRSTDLGAGAGWWRRGGSWGGGWRSRSAGGGGEAEGRGDYFCSAGWVAEY